MSGSNGFNKRQKERARKEKQDEKLAKKAARRAGLLPSTDDGGITPGTAQEGAAADAPQAEPLPVDADEGSRPST